MSTAPLPETTPLAAFRAAHQGEKNLGADNQVKIAAAAVALLQDFYVHLGMKRVGTSQDPLDNLRGLSSTAKRLLITDRAFHDRMIEAFATLHDRHTLYSVPAPYRDRVAVLPFRVQRVGRDDTATYLITAITPGWLEGVESEGDEPFEKGVEVLTWNGRPIETVVQDNAQMMGGTHPDARTAWGVAHLTDRPLTFTKLPDDDEVRLTYRRDRREGAITLSWRVYQASASVGADRTTSKSAYSIALDRRLESVREAQVRRFSREDARTAGPGPAASSSPAPGAVGTSMPDLLQFRILTRAGKRYGHLRIWSFNTVLVTDFVREIRRLLDDHHPEDGLIVDVRGNPGGQLMAGEKLLQLFTPGRIQPEGLQFVVTPGTDAVTAQPDFGSWHASISVGETIGEQLSAALPIEPGYAEAINSTGQRYYGPVVLLVDAVCYSTTEAFAAGFQDHAIGKVIGVGSATGGGGGNPWSNEAIAALSGVPLDLPEGVSFDVAVRRNLRVGPRNGTPIEQLGVQADDKVELTADDVLHDNSVLLLGAIKHLEQQPSFRLKASLAFTAGVAAIDLETRGIDTFDVYLDGRPVQVGAAANGRLEVRADPAASHLLQLYGYGAGELVAAWRESFGTGPAMPVTTPMAPLAIPPTREGTAQP